MADPQNWWESAPVVSPATDPSFPGIIPGAPKPKEPKAPVFVPEHATQMFDPNTNTYKPVPQPPGESKDALKDAIAGMGLDELLQNLGRARDNLKSPWSTGTMGAIAELKPGGGTPRDNFIGNINAVKGSVIQEKLQSLKEASKTGASGFGSLSEKEGELLAGSVASLNPNMSPDEYVKSFNQIAKHALTLRAIRDGHDPNNPEVAKAIAAQADTLSRLQEPPSPSPKDPNLGEGDGLPGSSTLTPEQEKAYRAFLGANPNPTGTQVKTFLEGLGVKNVVNADKIAEGIRKGQGISTAVRNYSEEEKVARRVEELKQGGASPILELLRAGGNPALLPINMLLPHRRDDAVTATYMGAGDTASAGFLDEGDAAINAFGGALAGKGSFGDLYNTDVAANRQYQNDLSSDHPYAYAGGQIAGGVVLPTGEVSGALDAARAGGRFGALYGLGSGTDLNDRIDRGIVGGAGGAVVGGATSALAPYVARAEGYLPRRLGGSPRGMAPDVARAAANENVDLIRPMVDPAAVSEYGALESNVYSQPIIRGAAGRVRGQIEDRVAGLAPGGTALETEAAGGHVQDAARRFITRSRGVANTLYNRARAIAGPDAAVTPRAALQQMRQEIQSLRETPNVNQGELAFINELGEDLTNGPLTIDAIRNLRSSIRGRINQSGLTATQADARANRVLDALQQDVAAALPAGAATAYRRADLFYRERMTHIDDVIARFLGPRDRPISGEQAFARLKSMASPGGDGRRLAAIMRSLDGNERQDIAATIAQSLGRRGEDEPFSTALFLSQTRKLSPSARRTIFGPDGAQSIDNLRLLSQRLEGAETDINRSRSATVLERQGWRQAARTFIAAIAGMGGQAATGSIAGGVAGVTVAAGAMGASAARRVLSARAMVNPRVSRWLAEAADVSSPEQAAQSVRKLGVIIAREPALAHELRPIQEMLTQRITQPLAAQSGDQNEQR
jgi:hypothetical protein